MSMFKWQAFTLSELLISLSVLGLISALTLPNVYNAVKKQKEESVFREVINTLNVATNSGYMEGKIYSFASLVDFMKKNLNYTAYCASGVDDPTKPCNINNRANRTIYERFTLTNGSTIAIPTSEEAVPGAAASIVFYLDANGTPVPGFGVAWMTFNYSQIPQTSTICGTTVIRPGEFMPIQCMMSNFKERYGIQN
jgi:prepilin-type N-terminal cleavage/methylation domain-containing protein